MLGKADWTEYVYTRDGMRVELTASVNSVMSTRLALENGARSVGLLRSEGLYQDENPGEEALYAVYREIFELLNGGRIVARVCDFGGDYRPEHLCLPQEDNPQMGFRSIRMLLSRPELFTPQLRALLRASVHGSLAILMPMVSTVDEVLRARRLLEDVRAQLAAEGIPTSRKIEFGVMVETPAAALICDLLARHVDFFCIGTHTLTQFTLITERSSALYAASEARSRAVLRLILSAVEQSHRFGIQISVIGASASDPELVPLFLALGISSFSAEPELLPQARGTIRQTNAAALREPLLKALRADDGPDFFRQ